MPHAPRRFTILDGMVLVAATAAGLAVPPAFVPELDVLGLPEMVFEVLSQPPTLLDLLPVVAELVSYLAIPCLLAWTLATVALSLRRPRPPLRRLARRPGILACVMASAVFLLTGAVVFAIIAWTVPILTRHHVYVMWSIHGTVQGGLAVACCWATMLLSRVWWPEPTWLDRLGRLLGACWLVLVPFFAVGILFFPMY
jgi:hypothetical protein